MVRKIDVDFEELERKDFSLTEFIRATEKKLADRGFRINNFRGEVALYKKFPGYEVVGTGMNTLSGLNEMKMFSVWARKDFYRIFARIYCITKQDVIDAAHLIDDALEGRPVVTPFEKLRADNDDLHIVKINGKWEEGVLKYSFSKGWYAVSKEELK